MQKLNKNQMVKQGPKLLLSERESWHLIIQSYWKLQGAGISSPWVLQVWNLEQVWNPEQGAGVWNLEPVT